MSETNTDDGAGTIIKTDGTELPLTPSGSQGEVTLEDLQKAVGGYIELLPRCRMVVNEEGRLLGLDINAKASAVAGMIIVGDVVLFETNAQMRQALSGKAPRRSQGG